MYKYDVNIPYSMKDLLEEYSQEDIFRIVFKDYPNTDILYISPFRSDEHPNCFFDWYKGKLYFKDYADVPRDCFQAVKDYFHIDTYKDVTEFIVNYFVEHPILPDQKPYTSKKEKDVMDCSVTFRVREFEERDRLHWSQFCITKEQIAEDHVSCISMYRFYSNKTHRWVIIHPFDIAYAISGFESRCKVYRPYNKNKCSKWTTNCTVDDIGNIDNIDFTGKLLIITKSYKDYRVIKNQGYKNVIWFQSEKIIPHDKLLIDLASRYDEIVIFYDNDEAGITGAEALKSKLFSLGYQSRSIFSPYSYMKDPAEIVSIRGEQELKDFLWKNCPQ